MSCIFGFDVGSRRTGVAIGNTLTCTARQLAVLGMDQGEPEWVRLDTLRREWLPDTLVVGLPLTLDGEEQAASRRARRFADALQQRYQLPVHLIDERHSSQEAAERFAHARASGLRRRSHAEQLDADAAAIILERWLLSGPVGTPSLPEHRT
ncbi:Holliday junction resolvase RuvX [Frateuria aurantia]